jgi:hypothetical protein
MRSLMPQSGALAPVEKAASAVENAAAGGWPDGEEGWRAAPLERGGERGWRLVERGGGCRNGVVGWSMHAAMRRDSGAMNGEERTTRVDMIGASEYTSGELG